MLLDYSSPNGSYYIPLFLKQLDVFAARVFGCSQGAVVIKPFSQLLDHVEELFVYVTG